MSISPSDSRLGASTPFGAATVYANASPPRTVQVTAETCFNLSLFKGELRRGVCSFIERRKLIVESDLVKEYRKLDDHSKTRRRPRRCVSGLICRLTRSSHPAQSIKRSEKG